MNRKVSDKALDKPKTLKTGVYREGFQYWACKGRNAQRLVDEVLGALGL
jgi:hypothetical protein